MFNGCTKLKYLDLTYFNTSNVTDMSYLFYKCHKLKEIKGINIFNTAKVEYMDKMFNECYELENLDLSNFNTSNVTDMTWMFDSCNKLKYLNVSNFIINGETKKMFFSFNKKECKFIANANDKKLIQLYNSS